MLFLFQCRKFVILKKIVSILLLAVMLFSSSEFDQLVKVPALISHFLEHKASDKNLSFVSFIVLHYQSDFSHNDQDSKHHDLPFKSHECQGFSQLMVMDYHPAFNHALFAQKSAEKPELVPGFYNSENVASIWQPPQA